MVLEEPDDDPNAPFTLEIEYKFDSQKKTWIGDECPFIEILVIIQPFSKVQSYLGCSQD